VRSRIDIAIVVADTSNVANFGDGIRKVWRFRLSELTAAMLHPRQRSHVPEEI
jgi:hypothetical protein